MSIWILTTGNSDVQLKTDDNWERPLYEEVRYDEHKDIRKCDKFAAIQEDKATELYPVPARILGIVYENHLQNNYDDLAFPLLDTFTQYFLDNPDKKPSIIIVLLTDQRNIFVDEDGDLNEKVENEFSPFWQDTCTLKTIFQEYFQQKEIFSSIKLEFHTLRPAKKFHTSELSKKGLDNWEKTLELVKEEFKKIQEKLAESPEYDQNETVYVSHQAGTPAISSAVQFVSLGNFKNVKFLSSNIFFNDDNEPASEPQLVEVSNYWMGFQIEKAKQLVCKGLPGAALSMLEEIGYVKDPKNVIPRLKNMVRVFNICDSLIEGGELEVEKAIQRVVYALTLIEIFFKEKNYLQGIALLAAAQETFLRAAISHALKDKKINLKYDIVEKNFNASDLIKWQQLGLLFLDSADAQLEACFGTLHNSDKKKLKIEVLKQLFFPLNHFYNDGDTEKDKFQKINLKLIKDNPALFKWLCGLQLNFQPWDLLEWICIGKKDKNEYDDDIRNGLMHNLLGFNEEEVIKYLLGNSTTPTYTDVPTTYQKEVKEKFINEIKNLGLPYNERNLYDELEAIANDIT